MGNALHNTKIDRHLESFASRRLAGRHFSNRNSAFPARLFSSLGSRVATPSGLAALKRRSTLARDRLTAAAEAAGFGWPDQCSHCLMASFRFRLTERRSPFARPFMRSTCRGMLGILLAVCLALPANAQDSLGKPDSNPADSSLTGKERLGRKWMDQQRINNCNVPIDKRGNRPRPSACPPLPRG